MPKRIFFDANVIIDLANKNNAENETITWLSGKLTDQKNILLCSPVSFAITYYTFGKTFKNKKFLNEKVAKVFSAFSFTNENSEIMTKVMQSSFTDLEDALQYYSALDAKADAIITKNYFDFSESIIPVYHPLHYMSEFLL